jgi:hypothetical protein
MNLHKRLAEHLPDQKNVVSDRECLAINRKDYAIGEAGPFMAFLNAVQTRFNPAGLADYELFSLAMTLSYTKVFTPRTRILSLSEGTDAIAGAVHYSLWLRGATKVALRITGDSTAWAATGPSSAEWLELVTQRQAEEAFFRGCWVFADYRNPGAQEGVEAHVMRGAAGFIRGAAFADAILQNPVSNPNFTYAFSSVGHGLVMPVAGL